MGDEVQIITIKNGADGSTIPISLGMLPPSARVEVPDRTVGKFVTDKVAENGRQIDIIGQTYVNNSVQFLGFSDQAWGSGLLFIDNLMDHVEVTG